MTEPRTPWYSSLGGMPAHLDYDDRTIYETVRDSSNANLDRVSCMFYGKNITYRELLADIDAVSNGLTSIGVKAGDRVMIILPNTPQCIVSFYALNKIGAVAMMIHPLSGENELSFYANDGGAKVAITTDQFYPKLKAIRDQTSLETVVVGSIADTMGTMMSIGYRMAVFRKIKKVSDGPGVVTWKHLVNKGRSMAAVGAVPRNSRDVAAILYTGGTTGTTKGVMLSDYAFNALVKQTRVVMGYGPDDSVVVAMPMFHGFGLAACTHSAICMGAKVIPFPRFDAEEYMKTVIKYKSSYLGATPSLYEMICNTKALKNADLSFVKRIYVGADKISAERKEKIEKIFRDHNANVEILGAYGVTEGLALTAVAPPGANRADSVGIPMPDCYVKIVEPGTDNEVPYGEEGEICISGPSIMIGYLNQPEETKNVLRTHADGRTWMHTGDLGTMDEEGFITFVQRIKRMIVTNGYNVYPSQLENALESHEFVKQSCVIGIPDKIKIQKVKIFVILKSGVSKSKETEQILLEYLRKNVARYAVPHEIEFRDEFPLTKIGKVAYRELEKEFAGNQSGSDPTH